MYHIQVIAVVVDVIVVTLTIHCESIDISTRTHVVSLLASVDLLFCNAHFGLVISFDFYIGKLFIIDEHIHFLQTFTGGTELHFLHFFALFTFQLECLALTFRQQKAFKSLIEVADEHLLVILQGLGTNIQCFLCGFACKHTVSIGGWLATQFISLLGLDSPFFDSELLLREIAHNLLLGLESASSCLHGYSDRTQPQFFTESNKEVETEPDLVISHINSLEVGTLGQLVPTLAEALVHVQ